MVKKIQIVCDTNIWYNIANKKIKIENLDSRINLIGTYLSLEELMYSPNLLSEFDLVIRAIRTFFNYSDKIIECKPWHHLQNLDNPKLLCGSEGKKMITDGRKLLKNDYTIPEDKKADFENLILARQERLKDASKILNDLILRKVRPNIKTKQQHMNLVSKDYSTLKRVINNYLKKATNTTKDISANFDWRNIELLFKTWKTLMLDIDTSYSQKFKHNHWYDLFNLLYVQPGMKYWTKDRTFINLIKKANLDDYLYQR